jgi:hypothetical protein
MRNVSCTLSDSETLVAKEVKSVPVTYWELEIMLGMFGNLLIVLLGTTHTVVVAYKEMWQLLKSSLCEDFHAALEYRAHVKLTHVLCSIQLTMYSWFSHRRARLTNSTDTGLKIYYSSNPDASLCTAFAASPIVPTCLPQETLLDVSTRVSRDGVNVVFGHQWLRFGPVWHNHGVGPLFGLQHSGIFPTYAAYTAGRYPGCKNCQLAAHSEHRCVASQYHQITRSCEGLQSSQIG